MATTLTTRRPKGLHPDEALTFSLNAAIDDLIHAKETNNVASATVVFDSGRALLTEIRASTIPLAHLDRPFANVRRTQSSTVGLDT